MTAIEIERHQDLPAALQETVLGIAADATAADGAGPLSEDARLAVRHGRAGAGHLVARADGAVVGYAFVGPAGSDGTRGTELVIDPRSRRRGFGRALARDLLSVEPGPVEAWAHGGHPGAAALAAQFGFEAVRELRLLERPVPEEDRAGEAPRPPAGVTLRTFVPGRDEEPWLALNASAFAHHPEQGRWTRADLDERMAEPWFDPAGFFLAEQDGRLRGFHWTKTHPAGAYGPDPVGEVYVVGVDPAEHGRGLGRMLTATGLRHLAGLGLRTVVLYVDADNTAAVRLYSSLGFTTRAADTLYRRPAVAA